MKENNIETSDKIYAPLVDAMTIAYKNPTYQFHIPGHTKGQGVYKKFKENIENRNIKIQKYKELYKPKLY